MRETMRESEKMRELSTDELEIVGGGSVSGFLFGSIPLALESGNCVVYRVYSSC